MLTVLLFLLPVVQGYLNYAKYDAYNFLCDQYVPLCDNFLDEIGCDSKNRTAIGCPGYPQVPNNITNWVGKCVCGNPTAISTVSSSRITTELMSNRVVPDMYWLLEPWNTGPPYDLTQSYSIVCNLMLNRLGCPAQNQVVVANNQPTAKGKTDNFQCTCGKFKDATNAVNNLVIDQINKISLTNLPVFSDPVYLSVSVSIGMVLIVGKIFSIIAVYFTLPSVVGFLLAGLAMQNILSPMFLKGAGFPFPSPGGELKSIALIIILMRAGLSIKFDELRKTSAVTFFMCFIPYLGEFFTFMYLGESVFGYDIYTMGLFASIMAPLSPSIVIAGLLSLMATSNKDYGYTPKQVLIAAPLEVVISIILFGVFSVLLQTAPPSLYPWVVIYPLSVNIVLIPVTIIFSTCLGILLGYVAAHYINYRVTASEDYMWVRLNSNPQVGSNTAEFLFVMLVICYMFYNLCTVQYIQYCSGVLVVFSMSVTVSKLVKPNVLIDLSEGLKGIWVFAEAFLFTITGTSLVFDSNNGPLAGQRGLTATQIGNLLGVMIASTFGRLAALVITMGLIYNAMPPHRQNWKWMSLFWINCWLFQLPKATVQATLGSVAYNSRLIPGAQGQNQALFISQATAFAVLIFAPVGSILTKYIGAPISLYLQKLDEEASWDSANFQSKALDSGKDLVTDHGGEMNSTFEVETPRALEDDIEGDVELK